MEGSLLAGAGRGAFSAWRTLLDLVYPPECLVCGGRHGSDAEVALCGECGPALAPIGEAACPRCGMAVAPHAKGRGACAAKHDGLVFRQAVAVCPYRGPGERIVKALKFGRDMRALDVMGPMLAERVAAAPFAQAVEVVVPVPLHWRRRAVRRFNQAELLAEQVAAALGAEFEPRALKRTRYTTPQAMLAPEERAENLRGAFAVRDAGAVRGARALLVDDVMTTCSTAKECSRALRRGGARSVYAAVSAR